MRGFKVLVLCLAFLLVASLAIAGEVDVLIKKLVEKGVLTDAEAKAVLADTKESVKKQLADGKLDSVPAWAQNTKWSGDFRLRFEDRKFVEPASEHPRNDRTNIRLRYGFEAKVNPEIKAGARLATGSSANQGARTQALEHTFESKAIWLDRAYMEYSPKRIKGLKLIGGKFDNPFWKPTSLIWGAEINPEGVAAQYTKSVKPGGYPANIDLFANLGALPLHQTSNMSPVLYVMQAGASTNVFDRKLKAAVAYYYFDDLKGLMYNTITPNNLIAGTFGATNTTSAPGNGGNFSTGGNFVYNYRVLSLDAEYPITDIILKLDKKKITLPLGIFGSVVKNVAEEVKKDGAWAVGFRLGKAKDPGSWDFTYDYRRIARDATVDFLNNPSFHGGGTNAKGHYFSINYILLKDTTLSLSYYDTQRVQGIKFPSEELDRLDLECLVKF